MDFKNIIQQIKNEYDIAEYIKANGVDLEQINNGQWKGLCPFHNEKTPSFIVSESFQNYKCFGCGESGDILTFAQHIHTISFYEALKMLADDKNITIKNEVSDKVIHNVNAIRKVVSDARDFFRYNYENLNDTHPAKQEVIKRGLDVNNELYGYSLETPNDLYKYLKAKGHQDKDIKDSNLVLFFDDNRPPWDFFHGRLMITLSDYLGRPISFTSRKIYEDDRMKGKYVNGKDSPVFHKKNMLFGADLAKQEARKQELIYIVEGQFDQIAMYEKGIKNVVATSGTAFTEEHANLLLRMVGDSGEIIFIMDGDEAGIKAAISIFKEAKSLHSNSKAVLLKNGKDPCDYLQENIELLINEINKAIPLHDFVIEHIIKNLGKIEMSNRQKFISMVAKYAKYTDNPIIVNSMLNKASVLSAVSIDNIREIYNNIEIHKKEKVNKENKKEKLKPKIKIDLNNEADSCMFTSLALLARIPDELISLTPKTIHNKFKPFMKELGDKYIEAKKNNRPWRFIAEDYSDEDFAKALQNKMFLEEPLENIKNTKSQYEFLFNRANMIYKQEYEQLKKSRALSSIIDSTDPKQIAEALKLYKRSSI
jgi:DNA primase